MCYSRKIVYTLCWADRIFRPGGTPHKTTRVTYGMSQKGRKKLEALDMFIHTFLEAY